MTDTDTSTVTAKPKGIDPRGPRVVAGITAVVLLAVIALALAGQELIALVLFAAQTLVFLISTIGGVQSHPYGYLYKGLIRPRLAPPTELEDPRPPSFAQGVGLFVLAIGLVLHLVGVPFALVISASAAFVAAFLNSVFGYCLGCQLYLLLVRVKVIRAA